MGCGLRLFNMQLHLNGKKYLQRIFQNRVFAECMIY